MQNSVSKLLDFHLSCFISHTFTDLEYRVSKTVHLQGTKLKLIRNLCYKCR